MENDPLASSGAYDLPRLCVKTADNCDKWYSSAHHSAKDRYLCRIHGSLNLRVESIVSIAIEITTGTVAHKGHTAN